MTISLFLNKARTKLWRKLVSKLYGTALYPYIYLSFWNSLIHKEKLYSDSDHYFTARPNRGAGIGHQLANWIAGYWFARQFGLRFAHLKFSSEKWESVLGFGENEPNAEELIKKYGYKKVLLPLFDEQNRIELDRIKKIIGSYKTEKVVFIAEQDQGYKDQYGIADDIRKKFHRADCRKTESLIYKKEKLNIAIHVRRGDIVIGQQNNNPNLKMRWQNNDYFLKVLSTVIENIKPEISVAVYLFSQGGQNEFKEFEKFRNINYCLDMSPVDSFVHMVFADILIISKSSFSYKPALLSNGIKICPGNFWHNYPESNDWILTEDDGTLNSKEEVKLKLLSKIS